MLVLVMVRLIEGAIAGGSVSLHEEVSSLQKDTFCIYLNYV